MKQLRFKSLALLAFAALPLTAAADGTGTIDDANLAATYSSAAYTMVNPLPFGAGVPEVGPFCQEGTPLCDTYRLTLNLSDEWRSDPKNEDALLEVSIVWDDANTDFDPYIYNPAGEEIAGPAGSQGVPEFYAFTLDDSLPNGEYLIQVMPWLAVNESFDMEIRVVGIEESKSQGLLNAGGLGTTLLLPLVALAALRRRPRH